MRHVLKGSVHPGVCGQRFNVCRRILIVFCVLVPMAARANPVMINPPSLVAFIVVAGWALIVETGIVAFLVAFAGLAPLRFFGGYLLANVAVFTFVFWPLQQRLPLTVLEAMVVAIDAVAIRLLANFELFQRESYRRLGWRWAFLISLAGNAASYCIGAMASHQPWYEHLPME